MNDRATAASRPSILLAVLAAIALSMLYLIRPVAATQPDPNHKVTICHRTASESNPYVRITVDEASVDGIDGNDNGKGDHLLEHTGPVWPARAGDPEKWGDIIPPFYADGAPTDYDTLNWDEGGQTIFDNSCNFELEQQSRVAIVKVNNQSAPVLPGTNVSFTLTVSVSNGPADDVVVVDTLPAGYDDPDPLSISDSGVWDGTARTITWDLGDDVTNGEYPLTYEAAVSASAKHGDALVNVAIVSSSNSQCPDEENLEEECEDDSTVTVRVPTLVIDKSASTEVVQSLSAQVTWTLTYTLTNGPVHHAVITDPLPAGLSFVSATDGGTIAAGTITWTLGTLTTGGTVSYVTTVDSDAPETGPILNTATIDSDETAPDDGVDSITITSEVVEAGTSGPSGPSGPAPSVPDSAMSFTPAGQPITIPVELLVAFVLLGLGGLTLANVKAARRRR